jgi:hypothetical protein
MGKRKTKKAVGLDDGDNALGVVIPAPGEQTPATGSDINGASQRETQDITQEPTKTQTTPHKQEAPGTGGNSQNIGKNAETSQNIDESGVGDVISVVAETAAEYGISGDVLARLPRACARDGETSGQCRERLRQEARTSGMTRRAAVAYAGRMVDEVWIPPPPPPEPEPEVIEEPEPEEPEPEVIEDTVDPEPPEPCTIVHTSEPTEPDQGVPGLGELPESWGELPANASLQAEISWVTANRLRVRGGSGVDLSKALSPAPSYSALSWLETSILFPSKFADISVKATQNQEDEREHVRREKMAIEEIRGLLAEMLEDGDG